MTQESFIRKAIRRAKIRPRKGVEAEAVEAALTKALAATAPDSEHGKLLGSALRTPSDKDRTPEQRVVVWLLRRAETPTAAAVANRIGALASGRETAARRHELRVEVCSDYAMSKVLKFVDRYRAEHKTGPLWSEVFAAVGVDRIEGGLLLLEMKRRGIITFTKETRSLRISQPNGKASVPQPAAGKSTSIPQPAAGKSSTIPRFQGSTP